MKRRSEKKNTIEDGSGEPFDAQQHGDTRGDEKNIAILFFLYLLQGIPIGLSSAIPMILQNRGVSYRQQAEFSFVNWPFSLKLLWAPIVDSMFSQRFGRRKTWLIPTQYCMGLFMLFLSGNIDTWLGDKNTRPNIELLTALFFSLNFLAATQDVAVDGWALTMLKRCNVGHASTCNSVGQTAGYFLGYVLFIALESAAFCNGYLRSTPSEEGLVTLPGFLQFWGWVFIGTTTLVAIFKHEDSVEPHQDEPEMDITHAYKLLLDIIKLPSIKTLAIILLTAKIGFSACDAVTGLKMVDAGIPKEKMALMAVPMVPLQIVLPLAIAKYTVGPRPMDVYLKAIPYRLAFGLVAAFLVWLTPFVVVNGDVPLYYYVGLIVVYSIHQVTLYSMFVAVMAFFARISDPAVGGTYMTLLNTLCNLGGNWPATTALWFVDAFTFRQCSTDPTNDCSTAAEREQCANTNAGECHTQLDGYYIESLLCVIIGVVWLRWGRRKINHLQNKPHSAWQVVTPHHKS
ncbi:acetyl-coenzyme A transporter 1 [Neodiprion fabricii]|uniref:acetyl-coenzyme A transporter 1 n=1 Tax=Neodiprion fabricii TaxID=2872261 RepID=UPI001ED97379|nr:acetyl-coenzyme A transporter 1 [Neodiprion fabricii]XP_046433588.1 acetyl-coenzyme A transporter 1 [Neodiprion fabricii]XP_046433589.1 acetyl-coenzyme A transporter 1 [Neodiprion fabricii]XP_046433590.1 acetyl-coenzyme A transporter 1 [Neodiprion fabricii]XP_046433591.1 acetyl-coenzyme A transporter 1 [Neodiprion fabricii]XP_046433592.1 acetyl-coenzyme A transporter 1 [Neodiprion fabricii]